MIYFEIMSHSGIPELKNIELGDVLPFGSSTENEGTSNQIEQNDLVKKIIGSIFILVVWWVFAITNILPFMKNSMESDPDSSARIFFIFISIIWIISFIFTNYVILTNIIFIDITHKYVAFITNLTLLIIWFVVGTLVVLPKIQDSMENHSRIWSLALLSYLSFIITSSCVFCFTRNLIMWFDNQDIS